MLKGLSYLKNCKFTNPILEVRIILATVLGKDPSYLMAHGDESISPNEEKLFFDILKRRKIGEPLQYILGETEFMMRRFFVESGVLIPRNDTEIAVEEMTKLIRKHSLKNFLEIGCGSGAVAITIALDTQASVTCTDISQKALEITKKNKKYHKAKLTVIYSDLFSNIKNKFDIIFSNPPYIPSGEIDNLQIEVKDYEPRMALDGGKDGMDFYRFILKQAPLHLKEKGYIVFEIGHDQAPKILELMRDFKTQILQDFNGLDRVIIGQRKE